MNSILIQFSFLFRWILKITNKPVVLCYHRITKQKFDTQVTFFKKLAPVQSFKTIADNSINAKPTFGIVLTMDDCYYEDFINATQILEKHNLPCTFFVPTKYSVNNTPLWPLKIVKILESPELVYKNEHAQELTFKGMEDKITLKSNIINELVWDEEQTNLIEEKVEKISQLNGYVATQADKVIDEHIIKMYAENPLFSFQSHTFSHPKLYLQTEKELAYEFAESKKYLENAAAEEQYLICYPYGSAKHIGSTYNTAARYYKYGVTLQTGSIKNTTHPMLIPRIGIYEHDTPLRILLKIIQSQFK